MKFKIWILTLPVMLIIAFVSYRAGKNAATPTNAHQIEEEVKNELISLTAKDFEEYQNLKGMEERYKKADEILGKIVTVFLADLGLKLSFQPVNPAMIEGACAIPMAAATPLPAPTSTPMSSSSDGAPLAATNSPTPRAAPNTWIQGEKELLRIQSEEHALEELKKIAIPDIYATLTTATSLDNADQLEMKGTYTGEINFFDKKAHPTDWNIKIRIQYDSRAAEASNNSYITLSNKSDGKTFSTSRSNRNGIVSQNFSRSPGSRALLVNVYGDDGYIQIYPLGGNGTRTWVGNYYHKKKIGQYEFAGQVTLNR